MVTLRPFTPDDTDWLVDRRGATDPTVAAPILPVAGVDPVPEAPT